MSHQSTLSALVTARELDPSGAVAYELRSPEDALPAFTAGSHIALYLSNGMTRSYSLMNSEADSNRYVVGVGLDKNSRGGSRFMHTEVQQGTRLEISRPSNLFPLSADAPRTVMIAGGIGITPFLSMISKLNILNMSWRLHYCARTRAQAPFLSHLIGNEGNIVLHFDDETNGTYIDLDAVIRDEPSGTHFYCCGPGPMLSAFDNASAHLPAHQVHTERFSSSEAPATAGGFTVTLSQLGKSVRVVPGKTILEALQAVGVEVPFSCLAGVCGTCQMAVLSGTPDHRDLILTDKEKGSNKVMMVCCSGSFSDVLDLAFE